MKQLSVLTIFFCLICTFAQANELSYRWVYVRTNLVKNGEVPRIQAIMQKAKLAGYNGVLLGDTKFNVLDIQPPFYFKNVEVLKKTAKDLGLDIYPEAIPVGYSGPLLYYDPNLVEAVPNRTGYLVTHHELIPYPPVVLKNNDLEFSQGDALTEWWQDKPGERTFVDRNIKHSGQQSIRMEDTGKTPADGMYRIDQKIDVQPFRQYHLSVWVKTQDFSALKYRVGLAIGDSHKESLNNFNWDLASNQDWKKLDVVFNSMDNANLTFYFGVWDGKMKGKIWWDDIQLREIGLVNLVRREGCPLIVKGEDGTIYKEGQDFQPVKDELMGNYLWKGNYDLFHKLPVIHLTPNSRIKEGEHLKVSYYCAGIVGKDQVNISLSDLRVDQNIYKILDEVNKLFAPKGIFLDYEEMRLANWDQSDQSRHMTPGQLLADQVRRCLDLVHKVNPKLKIFLWSDMFDPNVNAHDHYYMVNGTLEGSWKGLSKDVIIANWNYRKGRVDTLKWFNSLGHEQILAGYYDESPTMIRDWLDEAHGIANVKGAMYTTWVDNYNDLEIFAQSAWGKP